MEKPKINDVVDVSVRDACPESYNKPYVRLFFKDGTSQDVTTNVGEMIGGVAAGVRARFEGQQGVRPEDEGKAEGDDGWRPTRSDDPRIHVRLENAAGNHVTTAIIPPFNTMPEVLIWGTRLFTKRLMLSGPPLYREAFGVFVVDWEPRT